VNFASRNTWEAGRQKGNELVSIAKPSGNAWWGDERNQEGVGKMPKTYESEVSGKVTKKEDHHTARLENEGNLTGGLKSEVRTKEPLGATPRTWGRTTPSDQKTIDSVRTVKYGEEFEKKEPDACRRRGKLVEKGEDITDADQMEKGGTGSNIWEELDSASEKRGKSMQRTLEFSKGKRLQQGNTGQVAG